MAANRQVQAASAPYAAPVAPRRRTNAALTSLVFATSGGRGAQLAVPEAPIVTPTLEEALRSRAVVAAWGGGDPALLGALSLVALLRARKLSSLELADAYLARIARVNGDGGVIGVARGPAGPDASQAVYAANGALNAYVHVYADRARAEARAADARLDAAARGGPPAPLLCGLPIALKDVIAVDGMPLSLGCPSLRGQRVAGDSVIWARLAAAGAVLLGHTHTGPWTADDLCAQTANPWRAELAIGGSSGGSAAAAAARLAALTIGTDTGNSVRNPAQQAGISALKPSHGMVPLTGVAPLIPGLDHAGPMAAAMEDVSLALAALAGPDPSDPRTRFTTGAGSAGGPGFPVIARGGDRPLAGVRIASTVSTEPEPARDRWHPDVVAALRRCEEELRALGAEVLTVTPPERVHGATHADLTALDRQVVLAETYAQREDAAVEAAVRLRHRHEPEGRDVMLGPAALEGQALDHARRQRRGYRSAWAATLAEARADAVLWPQKVELPPVREGDFTAPFLGVDQARANTLGWPCAQMPLGPGTQSGLPVGVDLAAPWGRDAVVLRIALEYQARHPHHEAVPAL
ncbi:MAG: amidase [Solirubrobacteraceae bacterium]|nr:amidase [Solirubrobacteraceae bacterium]